MNREFCLGPKVNTPEKLGELVRAGVNIGQYTVLGARADRSLTRRLLDVVLDSSHELLPWIVRVPPERH